VTQLAVRLLLLTGVRTGELRLATRAQFDLERGLWIIPAASLKQRMMLVRKRRKRVDDIPPYIVPLSNRAQEIVRQLLKNFKTAQRYLFAGALRLTYRMSENTVNRLDLLELGEVEVASRQPMVHLQGLPGMAWQCDRSEYGLRPILHISQEQALNNKRAITRRG
jgi:integrase